MKLTSKSAKALAIFSLIIIMLQVAVAMIGKTLLPSQVIILIEVILFTIIFLCIRVIVIFFKRKLRDIKEIETNTEV